MLALSAKFDKLIHYNRPILLPAFIFAFAILGNLSGYEFQPSTLRFLHWSFYVLSLISIMVLLYFNKAKPLFFIISMLLCYLLLNYLKKTAGHSFTASDYYLKLGLMLPINLLLFYFIPEGRLLRKQNLYFVFFLLLEVVIIEKLDIFLPAVYIQYAGLILFAAIIATMFIQSILLENILAVYLFYASLCLTFGFYFADSPYALQLFFGGAAIITFIAVCFDIYLGLYQDPLTGLSSRQSFMVASRRFPLKYSLGIVAIDEYENLKKVFGQRHYNDIVQMISNLIIDFQDKETLYRYGEDEFVIIFKNETQNEGYTHLEDIRRKVASSNFMLKRRKKPIKLTVSASISEKKRSDANAYEVLVRTHKALQKTYKFTQNITTKV